MTRPLSLVRSCTFRVALLASLGAFATAELDAQAAGATGVLFRMQRPVIDSLSLRLPVRQHVPAHSTGAERFVGAVVLGSLVSLGTSLLVDDGEPVILSYAAGSAAGVLLATAAREKPRHLSVLLASAVGALPLFVAAASDEGDVGDMAVISVGVITTPLLGAIAQRW